MECEDAEDEGFGFRDLAINSEVEPWGYIVLILIQTIIAGCLWFMFYSRCAYARD